jgi:hypothetical protein
MSTLQRRNTSQITVSFTKRPLGLVFGLALIAAQATTWAANKDCTLIVPANPLTAQGLATPYQLVATNPADGPCHETNNTQNDQSAFVQAAVLDPFTGQITIYNPLVIDQGTLPAVPPVVPQLPFLAVVAIWFGYNGDNLTLVGATPNVLANNDCHQNMGQFAYCNAPAFFATANFEILIGALKVPPLGYGTDNRLCPSVRSFAVADQDQSDNLTTTYLIAPNGLLAQNTAANMLTFPNAKVLGNPSDNRLTDVFLDKALGCTSWTVPDLANPGHKVPALPLNELQAAAYQTAPVALIPFGNPFVLNPTFTGQPDLAKVNEYRLGVDQFPAIFPWDASTTAYCSNLLSVATEKLILDRVIFTAAASPSPDVANNLFTFMANRFKDTYDNLSCQSLLGAPNPVTLITNAQGIVTDAIVQ